jgi:hypothetical protein
MNIELLYTERGSYSCTHFVYLVYIILIVLSWFNLTIDQTQSVIDSNVNDNHSQ